MIKFAPYISIYDLDEKFNFEKEVFWTFKEVIWTFSKNLRGITSVRIRLNIHLVTDATEERKCVEGSIKSIWKYFDQTKFLNSDTQTRKELTLTLIKDSFLEIAKELDWDLKKINDAYQNTLNQNIKFQFSTKPKYNKSRTRKGLIDLELLGNKVIITATILDKNDIVLIKEVLIETFTFQVDFFRAFKDLKWIDEHNFGFVFGPELALTISETGVKWHTKNLDTHLNFISSIEFNAF